MIAAFNALLECLVTGLFTALILWWLSTTGAFPVVFISPIDPDEAELEDLDDE